MKKLYMAGGLGIGNLRLVQFSVMARGQTPRGAAPVEVAVPPVLFVEELGKRGIQVRARVQPMD